MRTESWRQFLKINMTETISGRIWSSKYQTQSVFTRKAKHKS